MDIEELFIKISVTTENVRENVNNVIHQLDRLTERVRAEEVRGGYFTGMATAAIEGVYKSIVDYQSYCAELERAKQAAADLAVEITGLGVTYEKLNSGQKLSMDQIVELIRLYPEVSKHLAQTGDFTLVNGKIIEDIINRLSSKDLSGLGKAFSGMQESIAPGIFERLSAATDKAVEKQWQLHDAVNAVKNGEKLSEEVKKELLGLYPSLNEQVKLYGDAAFGNAKILETVERASFVTTTKIVEDEIRKTNAVIAGAKARLAAYELEEARFRRGLSKNTDELIINGEDLTKYNEKKNFLGTFIEDRTGELKKAQEQLIELEKTFSSAWSGSGGSSGSKKSVVSEENKLLEENDKWFKQRLANIKAMDEGSETRTDYTAIINAVTQLKDEIAEKYKDFPELVREKCQEAEEIAIEAAQKRADKLVHIEAKAVDDQIAQNERLSAYFKQANGLVVDGKEFTYGIKDEIKSTEQNRKINESRINELQSIERRLTETEEAELQKRLDARQSYNDNLISLAIKGLKEEQNAAVKAAEDKQKAISQLEKQISELVKAESGARAESIKESYKEQIRLAREAADEEINALKEKIRAIDELLRQDEIGYKDEDELDKIHRLKVQLEYENDGANRYELQKDIELKQTEFDRRKRREELEAEKNALSDRIDELRQDADDRRAVLESMRDAEISVINEGYDAYVKKLSGELEELKANGQLKLDELKAQLETEKQLYAKMTEAKEALTDGQLGEKIGEYLENAINESGVSNEVYFAAFGDGITAMQQQAKEAGQQISNDAQNELNTRLDSLSEYYTRVFSMGVENAGDLRKLAESTINGIISDLWNRIDEFGSVGRASGTAYGQAFVDASRSLIGSSGAMGLTPSEQAARDAVTAVRMMNQM